MMKNNRDERDSRSIHDFRIKIEEIDKEIIELLNHRFTISNRIFDLKKMEGISIEDPLREKELLNNLTSFKTDYQNEIHEVYQSILQSSKKIQWNRLFPRYLFIIGFMGSGKSTLGKKMSEKLGFGYIDTDEVIEKKLGMTIESLFVKKGESFFREMEKNVINNLYNNEKNHEKPIVVSCGGGLILDKDNQEKMKKLGTIIFLDVPPEIIYHRVKDRTHRPLLNAGQDLEKRIYHILEERYEIYQEVSDLAVPIHHETVEESLSLIYQKAEEYFIGRS